ncbi:unnamed protein product [Anisakis simplex]|uniref:Myotubularin phosphatase domain-containing protein n=1 Tax=Anisakis simplex TaxID=6269 RepID=A0A0M3KBJ5_ANISI|nr:unnamed protein product [Anisakis simplex]
MENCEGDVCGLHDEPSEKAQEAENNKQLENTSCSAPSDQSGSSFCLNLSDIRQYFPKTANYKVNDSNHSSPWCAVPERWAHARSFLRDKLNYWVQTLKSVKFSDEKDEQIAMRVIHQLAWLLKNSWDGRRESECPSETLWRARRSE